MNSLNSTLIEGELDTEPISSISPKGTSISLFSLCSTRYYKENDETLKEFSYFKIEAWGKLAEICNELPKTHKIRVVGRLKQDRWNDQKGNPHSEVKVVAEHVEIMPLRKP